MADLSRALRELRLWFAEGNIPTDSLTVILNFTDRHAAAVFDYNLSREINRKLMYGRADKPLINVRSFEMNGIKVKVESPLHEIMEDR